MLSRFLIFSLFLTFMIRSQMANAQIGNPVEQVVVEEKNTNLPPSSSLGRSFNLYFGKILNIKTSKDWTIIYLEHPSVEVGGVTYAPSLVEFMVPRTVAQHCLPSLLSSVGSLNVLTGTNPSFSLSSHNFWISIPTTTNAVFTN